MGSILGFRYFTHCVNLFSVPLLQPRLGSIMKNEKSERQLEQRLADLAGKEGEAKAKRPYMLSVALNSLPQADYELPTLPGQCEERR